ncbi:hypothetical protein J2X48_004535 [Bosea sp. BE271]|uniref:hypothetical protein n=1 Tax=Bosea TaxID=85413 RepID=UPI002864506E|nr:MULTISPECIES: hypothetical protein [Bosea]MDR6830921.1 hypothetical protein [Bosea robiniae]MDR6897705.1 hypothetical protein [Bosea sp. BE109]MDR7141102.1 hypothetical protein [Bosea sp. BE168]MDR7177588.1 hypothetical protein [Bosea sp. BE271]
MSIFLVRYDDGDAEQLCLDGSATDRDLWSAEIDGGMISRHLDALGVTVLDADHTEMVDGVLVNIHPLVVSGRAQRILATTYFMGSEQDHAPTQVLQ